MPRNIQEFLPCRECTACGLCTITDNRIELNGNLNTVDIPIEQKLKLRALFTKVGLSEKIEWDDNNQGVISFEAEGRTFQGTADKKAKTVNLVITTIPEPQAPVIAPKKMLPLVPQPNESVSLDTSHIVQPSSTPNERKIISIHQNERPTKSPTIKPTVFVEEEKPKLPEAPQIIHTKPEAVVTSHTVLPHEEEVHSWDLEATIRSDRDPLHLYTPAKEIPSWKIKPIERTEPEPKPLEPQPTKVAIHKPEQKIETPPMVKTHHEAVQAIFTFIAAIREKPKPTYNIQKAETTKPTTNLSERTIEFPDHKDSVIKQFLLASHAKLVTMSGSIRPKQETDNHSPAKDTHEEVYTLNEGNDVFTIQLLQTEGKATKIRATEKAFRILEQRLKKYIPAPPTDLFVSENSAIEEQKTVPFIIPLQISDGDILRWLYYLLLAISTEQVIFPKASSLLLPDFRIL